MDCQFRLINFRLELMKKFFQNKKVQDVLSWVFGIAIVISIPYLIIGVLSAGLAFKPLGYLVILIRLTLLIKLRVSFKKP